MSGLLVVNRAGLFGSRSGLNVNRSINFSCIQMFFTAFIEGQTIYRKPHFKVTKLKSKFSLIPG